MLWKILNMIEELPLDRKDAIKIVIILGNTEQAGMGAVEVRRYAVQFTPARLGSPVFFKIFSLLQSLCRAIQGEG